MSPSETALVSELETKIVALARRCIAAMYEDAFWMERFGERGRKHAEADSEYHVKYVAASLREADVTVFENYARWLRGVLASRGMCSWHLAESFRQLGRAMLEEGVSDPEPALSVLRAGGVALHYTTGDAGTLAALEIARVEAALGDDSYRLDELWSFLLDAIDREDAPAFRAHVDFVTHTLTKDEGQRARLSRTLDALRHFTSGHAPDALAERLFSGLGERH